MTNIGLSALFIGVFLASEPPSTALSENVDLIEINHYFDNAGKSVFDQLIYYNWDESAQRFNVRAWRLIKTPNQVPKRHTPGGKYFSAWHDGKLLRIVSADRIIETWTQYDPETLERTYFPKENRPDLLRFEDGKR